MVICALCVCWLFSSPISSSSLFCRSSSSPSRRPSPLSTRSSCLKARATSARGPWSVMTTRHPAQFGSSAGPSFGKPQRDCVSETSLLSQLAGPGELGSGSVSTTDEPLMTGKRDRGESIGQSMRDRENLHKILERKAASSIQGENEAQKNYQRLKLMWKSEGGSKEVQKLLFMNPIENLKLKDYSFFRRINGTMLEAKELVCVENWK